MLVVACVALASTNILMLGPNAGKNIVEGFEDDETDETEKKGKMMRMMTKKTMTKKTMMMLKPKTPTFLEIQQLLHLKTH